jgi:hypothetical protein
MGKARSMNRSVLETYVVIQSENLKGRDHLGMYLYMRV